MSEASPFGFPYAPYPEQGKLMEAIYECIVSSSVGCFESPTGTGKSLSAICASFHWLLQEEKRILDTLSTTPNASADNGAVEDDWMAEFYAPKDSTSGNNVDTASILVKYTDMLNRIAHSNTQRSRRFINGSSYASSVNRSTTANSAGANEIGEENDEFALKHYDSEEEKNQTKARIYASDSDGSDSDNSTSAAVPAGHSTEKGRNKKVTSVMEQLQLPQVFYCSRTHSQLAQFVAEMNKTCYARKDPITGMSAIRCVTLGSRKNMCINSAVTKLKSDSSMSEACLEMQKPASKTVTPAGSNKTSSSSGTKKAKLRSTHAKCEYHSRAAERHLSDRALSQVQDIEDVVRLGHDTAACPYYASRHAVQSANVVCLPYNMLLNKDMRESLGINIAGKVIIIDEAHNLIETINQLHSAELSVPQIDAACAAISAYLRRYQSQLSAKNLYYVNILSAVLGKLRKVLCPKAAKVKRSTPAGVDAASAVHAQAVEVRETKAEPSKTEPGPTTLTVNDFLFKSGLDGVNLFKLKRHIEETNVVQKIGGYAESLAQKDANITGNSAPGSSTSFAASQRVSDNAKQVLPSVTEYGGGMSVRADVVSALRCALELIACLTNLEGDGRLFLQNIPPHVSPVSFMAAVAAPETSRAVNSATSVGTKAAFSSNVKDDASSTSSPPAIKFVMLNPAVHFQPLLQEARSVLLLGGTMKPFSYFTSLLFPTVTGDRLRLFSCDHVVPASQVGAVLVPLYVEPVHNNYSGSDGATAQRKVTFEFTYDKRMSIDQTNALFNTLVEICANTPGGVVVFCTSFQYLEALLSRWRSSKVLYKLDAIKRLFAEPRANSSDANSENTWEAYKRQVETHPVEGAVLFSVINGKLSEGINFSDELARCVVVVGLPYPDVRDPVLQEKMHYVSASDTAHTHKGQSSSSSTAMSSVGTVSHSVATSGAISAAGRRLCENMCMKAVNQSIGRAIRHVRDYACVVLLDRRYQQEQFRSQLPGWILRNIQVCTCGGTVTSAKGEHSKGSGLGAQLQAFFAKQV